MLVRAPVKEISQPSHRESPQPSLLPVLGLFSTIMLVVGGVIGSGIFRKPGIMAAQLGSAEWLMVVWIVAGIITLFGALTNAEIAALIPETGGQYVYFERIYGPFFAFLYGWAIFAIIQSGSIAAVAYVFAEHAGYFVQLPEFPPSLAHWHFHVWGVGDVAPFREIGVKGLAAALILALTAVNYLGVRLGGLVQNVFTVAKLAAMLALVLGAFLFVPADRSIRSPGGAVVSNADTAAIAPETLAKSAASGAETAAVPRGFALLIALAAALQGAFWAYDGWNKITYVAGEVRSPQRNIPLGLLWGMLLVTAAYLLMNAAYLWVLPVGVMAKSKLVAADVAETIFAGGDRWVAVAVMISTFGTANAIILTTARVYYSMAHAGAAPRLLGHVHPRFHTPGASLLVQGVWSVLLLFSGTFDTLTDTLIFVTWIFYAAGAYGVFVLRRKQPDAPRSYRVPGYPWVPWVFIGFATLFLALTAWNDVQVYRAATAAGKPAMLNSVFGVLLVLAGAPAYFLRTTPAKQS